MNKLVSVVVPVYNAEKYLIRCVKSVIFQSYKKIEIILVNDGSEDRSLEICRQFEKADSRVRVISKKNKGLSDTRNAGLFSALGDYICFIDSDDFVACDFIETLLGACLEYKCDIAQAGIEATGGKKERVDNTGAEFTVMRGIDMIYGVYGKKHVENISPCNKMYSRRIFKGIFYPVGLIHEDEITTVKLFYASEKVAVTQKPLYYYFENPDSITRKAYSLKQLDILKVMQERMDFYREKGLYTLLAKDYELYLSRILLNYYKVGRYIQNPGYYKKKLMVKYKKALNDAPKENWNIIKRIFMTIFKFIPILYAGVYLKLKTHLKVIKRYINFSE